MPAEKEFGDQLSMETGSKGEGFYGVGGFLLEIVKVFLMALLIIMPIRAFLFQPFFVQGASMEPNFKDGEYLIINELGYKKTNLGTENFHLFSLNPFKNLERGDTIVFRYPKNPEQFFIKRVIGLPGETIKIENGKTIVINQANPQGLTLDEREYLPKEAVTTGSLELKIGADNYFVMGDNRAFSYDSRSWGLLPKDDVIGKVLIRAWPFSQAKVY